MPPWRAGWSASPLLLYLVRGDRALGPLGRARDWLKDHNAVVLAVVLTVIGTVLVAQGLEGPSSD